MNGEHRIAQYGQWDHYPTGQGATALRFCCEHLGTPEGRQKFREALVKTRFIDGDAYKALWKTVGADLDKDNGLVSAAKSNEFSEKYPHLHRDAGAKVLGLVLDGATDLQDEIEYASEAVGIFLVNMDKGTYEVYYGYGPNRGRFPDVPLLATFSLDNLPPESEVDAIMDRLGDMSYRARDPEDFEGDPDTPDIKGLLPDEVGRLAMGDSIDESSVYRAPAARRIRATIAAPGSCYDADGVPYLNVQDMLTDLRHYCDAEGLDFAKLSRVSCSRHKGQAKMDKMTAEK
jgi:hypothetical protein